MMGGSQDEVFEAEDIRSRKAVAMLAEKKMSIFEKALVAHPRNDDLWREYMELCRQKLSPVGESLFLEFCC